MMSNCQMLYLLVLASACLINANSVADRSDADDEGVDEIIGGTTVARGQHQYMAFLTTFYAGRSGSCGGTVISNRYILTAAHCVQNYKTGEIANTVEVRLKVYTIDPMDAGAELITVTGSDIKPHPLFYRYGGADFKYDIALIKLSADLPKSDYYLIGKLYMAGVDRTSVTAVGWGRTSSTATTATSKLMQVSFRIGTNDECKTFWDPKGDDKYNHEFQLCGVDPGKSVCNGDSGGPIVRYSRAYRMYSQVGITSFGDDNCEKGYAVFTRVSAHRDWINANSCYQGDGGFCPTWTYA